MYNYTIIYATAVILSAYGAVYIQWFLTLTYLYHEDIYKKLN